jgi:seryl-tRNA synthetase
MLDINLIRQKPDLVKKKVDQKYFKEKRSHFVDQVLKLDQERKKLLTKKEKLQADINKLSKTKPDRRTILILRNKKKDKKKLNWQLREIEDKFLELMYKIPNIVTSDVPVGRDENDNKVLRKWGKPTKFAFKPKEHWELGAELDIIDIPRAAKVSGARFNYLKGDLAFLEFAIVQHSLKVLTDEKILAKIIQSANLKVGAKPFIPVIPPIFIKPNYFQKMARLDPPEDKYYIPKGDLYLIGSAEHTLGAMYADETFEEAQMPVRYVGFSTCCRRESGSYGKDTKGILRVHQFDKIEMESFDMPENSLEEHKFMIAIQEYLMQSLKIPYQVVIICTGDMGAPDARQNDIEAWLPGQNKYRETHTADYMTDYQARRLNIKVRRKNGKTEIVHMNDATAFAIGRTIIAILENYQQKDGSVAIPKVLKPYMNGIKEIKPK